jgi:hypothetical protein
LGLAKDDLGAGLAVRSPPVAEAGALAPDAGLRPADSDPPVQTSRASTLSLKPAGFVLPVTEALTGG